MRCQNLRKRQEKESKALDIKEGLQLRGVVKETQAFLVSKGIENAEYDSFAIISDILNIDRTYYYVHGNDFISKEAYDSIWKGIKKRADHVPLQLILGKAYFYGYEFVVNGSVLIPRQDTEILVEQVSKLLKNKGRVLDMCTGSGCIILTLSLLNKLEQGIGIDISSDALEVAGTNKTKHNIENVEFVNSNLFSELKNYNNYFDIIVSNPPYIRSDVINELSKEVKDYDPLIALDGHEDGLYFYKKITSQAGDFLKKGGWLCYEIGYDQAKDVENIMREYKYTNITTVKDLNGLDRVVKGKLE